MGVVLVVLTVLFLLILIGFGAFVVLGEGFGEGGSAKNQMSRMVAMSRGEMEANANPLDKGGEDPRDQAKSRYTLEKRLRYAQWNIPPVLFRVLQVVISALMFFLTSLKFDWPLMLMSLSSGPLFMGWLLNRFVEKRFKAFDDDYSPFLLSLVSLLRTGMNPMTAVETAAKGLEDGSLIKDEVLLMLERMQMGVPEDKSIGSFGEDVDHAEIELFVQALLLSKRVGGTLSDTLERLSKQVRKRQYFRASAVSAVGMQRGAIWFILSIMVSLETYLYFIYPEAITDSLKDEVGWMVWQGGIISVLLGLYWIRQVTKIRV